MVCPPKNLVVMSHAQQRFTKVLNWKGQIDLVEFNNALPGGDLGSSKVSILRYRSRSISIFSLNSASLLSRLNLRNWNVTSTRSKLLDFTGCRAGVNTLRQGIWGRNEGGRLRVVMSLVHDYKGVYSGCAGRVLYAFLEYYISACYALPSISCGQKKAAALGDRLFRKL